MDVLMFNQEISLVAERNLQAVGATDCLEGQNKANIGLHLLHSTCKRNIEQSKSISTTWIVQSSIYYLMESNGTGRVMATKLFSPQVSVMSQSLPWWFFPSCWQWDQSSWSLSWWPLSAKGEIRHFNNRVVSLSNKLYASAVLKHGPIWRSKI